MKSKKKDYWKQFGSQQPLGGNLLQLNGSSDQLILLKRGRRSLHSQSHERSEKQQFSFSSLWNIFSKLCSWPYQISKLFMPSLFVIQQNPSKRIKLNRNFQFFSSSCNKVVSCITVIFVNLIWFSWSIFMSYSNNALFGNVAILSHIVYKERLKIISLSVATVDRIRFKIAFSIFSRRPESILVAEVSKLPTLATQLIRYLCKQLNESRVVHRIWFSFSSNTSRRYELLTAHKHKICSFCFIHFEMPIRHQHISARNLDNFG